MMLVGDYRRKREIGNTGYCFDRKVFQATNHPRILIRLHDTTPIVCMLEFVQVKLGVGFDRVNTTLRQEPFDALASVTRASDHSVPVEIVIKPTDIFSRYHQTVALAQAFLVHNGHGFVLGGNLAFWSNTTPISRLDDWSDSSFHQAAISLPERARLQYAGCLAVFSGSL